MPLELRAALAVVLIGVQAIVAIPILVRIVRARSARGVSLSTEAIWVVCGVGWAVYGAMIESVALMVSGSLAAVVSALIATVSWRRLQHGRRAAVALAALTALIFVAGFVIAGAAGFVVALSAVGVLQFLPQLWLSLRLAREGAATPGVSVLGGFLRCAYCLGWAAYAAGWPVWGLGFDTIEWPLLAWGFAGALVFAVQARIALVSRAST